ncbi:hypothetical protein TRIUR3_22661 [Triticum urartu]|uniref:Uncharacterized protein n=2 Tax=Triticum TaxID=4564 RepID=A0A9R0PXX0_TRITD|nr:hypothetical protein TRIUR3_22661 [Triticum urartu]VAH01856.1 unnamed protein product [Triticum turgidum subsp. durum]
MELHVFREVFSRAPAHVEASGFTGKHGRTFRVAVTLLLPGAHFVQMCPEASLKVLPPPLFRGDHMVRCMPEEALSWKRLVCVHYQIRQSRNNGDPFDLDIKCFFLEKIIK